MMRLRCELLESRENPVGPMIVDPIGIPVTVAPPVVVISPVEAIAPPQTPEVDPVDAAVLRILQETLDALARRW